MGGRGSSQAESGRLEGISSVILQPPGVGGGVTPKGGVTSSTPWSAGHTGTTDLPSLCVCVCPGSPELHYIYNH